MLKKSKQVFLLYIRNFIFGVEDSLVSTVGLLSGITVVGTDKSTIILTGVVLIFVEAFSMAVGSFLSEHSVEDYMKKKDVPSRYSVFGGTIMFFSYFVSGFIPLFPYLIFGPKLALFLSVLLALLTLFMLGIVVARIVNIKSVLGHGFKMLIIGGIAVIVGVIVGSVVHAI